MSEITPLKQITISSEISCRGVGLHTGKPIHMTLKPAPENSGIVFRRVDLDPIVEVPANVFNVKETVLSTCLVVDYAKVSTIEHLMSALSSLGVDNLIIDINGPEVPIMDGSSSPFIFLIQSAGLHEQDSYKKFILVKESIRFEGDAGQYCEFKPSKTPKFNITTDFSHPHKCFKDSNQNMQFSFSEESYSKEISRARTFGFISQYEQLRRNNLALGGGVHNAIVFDNYGPINKDGLRYENEPLRHKLLDVIGDIYLAGAKVIGEFNGYKPGHYMNNMLLRKLINTESAWELVDESSCNNKLNVNYLRNKLVTV
jgi:UDP-3-O-[3-hydroxymyristoyl] N-acetylglucosamine deacetylase